MSSNYHLSVQYNGQTHYVDLRADKNGNVVVDGRKYSISGDDKGLVDIALPIIRQNSDNIDTVVRALSYSSYAVGSVQISKEQVLTDRMDAHCTALEKAGFTGTVLVEKEGKLLLAQGYGTTRDQATTPFYIGSVSKQFTAAAIMQLVEQGIIGLDEPINHCLPQELESKNWKNVTIRHLLSHTSGIPNLIPNYGERAPELTVDMMLQEQKEHPLDFSPGTGQNYSNTGYLLLGKIIAHNNKRRMSYKEYIETNLLRPAGMLSSKVQEEGDIMPNVGVCQGHRQDGNGNLLESEADDLHMLYSAGGMISTVQDLARWKEVLNGNIPGILSRESVEQMTTPNQHGVGFGLELREDHQGRPIIAHDGQLGGFRSSFCFYPKENAFITVLCNSEDFDPGYVQDHLKSMALESVGSFGEPVENENRDYSGYEGTFASIAFPERRPLTFALEQSGRLQFMRGADPLPTYPLSNGRLFVPFLDLELELTSPATITLYKDGQPIDEIKRIQPPNKQ